LTANQRILRIYAQRLLRECVVRRFFKRYVRHEQTCMGISMILYSIWFNRQARGQFCCCCLRLFFIQRQHNFQREYLVICRKGAVAVIFLSNQLHTFHPKTMSLTLALRQAVLHYYLASKAVLYKNQQIIFMCLTIDSYGSELLIGNLRGRGNGILHSVGKQGAELSFGEVKAGRQVCIHR